MSLLKMNCSNGQEFPEMVKMLHISSKEAAQMKYTDQLSAFS